MRDTKLKFTNKIVVDQAARPSTNENARIY